jgi:hypothetical protein
VSLFDQRFGALSRAMKLSRRGIALDRIAAIASDNDVLWDVSKVRNNAIDGRAICAMRSRYLKVEFPIAVNTTSGALLERLGDVRVCNRHGESGLPSTISGPIRSEHGASDSSQLASQPCIVCRTSRVHLAGLPVV